MNQNNQNQNSSQNKWEENIYKVKELYEATTVPPQYDAKVYEAFKNPIIMNADGTLNRRQLRECIFSDSAEKAWLNALLHPIIHQETQRQIAEARSPYVLWVVPLLVENQLHQKADRVLVIDVAPETQIQRTMMRDHVSREHAEHILAAQATRAQRLAVADDVIDNNGAPDAIASDVARLHAQYLTFAAQAVAQEKP